MNVIRWMILHWLEVRAHKGRCTACPGPAAAALSDSVQGEASSSIALLLFQLLQTLPLLYPPEHANLFPFKFTCLEINN